MRVSWIVFALCVGANGVGSIGAARAQNMALLGVTAVTEAPPSSADGPETPDSPAEAAQRLDSILEKLRALVRESRGLAGGGVEVLAGDKAKTWDSSRDRARELHEMFLDSVRALSPDAGVTARVKQRMTVECAKLRATYEQNGKAEILALSELLTEASALKVTTGHAGVLGIAQDVLGKISVAFFDAPASPLAPPGFSPDDTIALLPNSLLGAMNETLSIAGQHPRPNWPTIAPWSARSAHIPAAESSAQLEQRFVHLRDLLQQAQALVPAGPSLALDRGSETFQKFNALSQEFTKDYTAYAQSLSTYFLAVSGRADDAFQRALASELATTDFAFSRDLLPSRVAQLGPILEDGRRVHARVPSTSSASETQGLMDLLSKTPLPRYSPSDWNATANRVADLLCKDLDRSFEIRVDDARSGSQS